MIISLLPDSERDVDGVCQGKHKSTVTENCIKLPRVNSIPPQIKKKPNKPSNLSSRSRQFQESVEGVVWL